MATKSPVWTVTVQYTDGTTTVESDVRNNTQSGAEKLVSTHCADTTKTIQSVSAVQSGAKFAGEL